MNFDDEDEFLNDDEFEIEDQPVKLTKAQT